MQRSNQALSGKWEHFLKPIMSFVDYQLGLVIHMQRNNEPAWSQTATRHRLSSIVRLSKMIKHCVALACILFMAILYTILLPEIACGVLTLVFFIIGK